MRKIVFYFAFICVFQSYDNAYSNRFDFFKAWGRDSGGMGTFLPTGRCTRKEIIESLEQMQSKKEGLDILEVGAADGVQTIPMCEKLRKNDVLIAVEIDEVLASSLGEKCEKYENVFVFGQDFLNWQPSEEGKKFDLIVFTAPLFSVPENTVRPMLNKCDDFLEEGGEFIYVSYVRWYEPFLKFTQCLFGCSRKKVDHFEKIEGLIAEFEKGYDVEKNVYCFSALIPGFEHPVVIRKCVKKGDQKLVYQLEENQALSREACMNQKS